VSRCKHLIVGVRLDLSFKPEDLSCELDECIFLEDNSVNCIVKTVIFKGPTVSYGVIAGFSPGNDYIIIEEKEVVENE
jgi:hypothetical protein